MRLALDIAAASYFNHRRPLMDEPELLSRIYFEDRDLTAPSKVPVPAVMACQLDAYVISYQTSLLQQLVNLLKHIY